MERNQVLIIAVVVATLGLFGLQFLSRGPSVDEVDRHSLGGSLQTDQARGGEEGDASTASGTGIPSAPGLGREVIGSRAQSDRRDSATSARQRSAQAILAGSSERSGGRVGASTAARTRDSARAGMAAGQRTDASPSGRLATREGGRSELIETLASQPASPGGLLAPEEIADPEQQIVLSVNSEEDTQKAEQAEGVEAAPPGNEGIVLTPDSVLAFPDAGNVRGDAGTISLDIQPNWAGGDESNNSLAQILNPNQWNNAFQLVKNGRYLRFILRDNTGAERDISMPIEAWVPGEQHNVTVTWGDATTAMYVDGRLVGQNTYPGQLEIRPGTPMHLGSAYANYQGFDGVMGKATVFGYAQSADDIATRY